MGARAETETGRSQGLAGQPDKHHVQSETLTQTIKWRMIGVNSSPLLLGSMHAFMGIYIPALCTHTLVPPPLLIMN